MPYPSNFIDTRNHWSVSPLCDTAIHLGSLGKEKGRKTGNGTFQSRLSLLFPVFLHYPLHDYDALSISRTPFFVGGGRGKTNGYLFKYACIEKPKKKPHPGHTYAFYLIDIGVTVKKCQRRRFFPSRRCRRRRPPKTKTKDWTVFLLATGLSLSQPLKLLHLTQTLEMLATQIFLFVEKFNIINSVVDLINV